MVLARAADGRVAVFPVAENSHRHGILDVSIVPARIPEALAAEARHSPRASPQALDYVGVLAVEMFVVAAGCW